MPNLAMEVIEMLGQTIVKVLPLRSCWPRCSHCLLIFGPASRCAVGGASANSSPTSVIGSSFRCSRAYFGSAYLCSAPGSSFGIHDGADLIAFYDNGHGPCPRYRCGYQGLLFLTLADFMLYWLHRMFHGGSFWKYHAIHHSSEELDWISAARFHPVNLFLGTIAVDVILLMAGISPNVMLWVGPFTTFHSAFVHANLSWTLGPFKYVLATAGIPPLASHPRSNRAGTPILPERFRSGIFFLELSACRKTSFPTIMASTISWFRRRLAGSWPIRFATGS